MIRRRRISSAIVAGLLGGLTSCAGAGGHPVTRAASEAPPTVVPSKPVARYVGLSVPESVAYDPLGDRYLVSNLNGDPLSGTIWGRARSNHGFISLLSPDGQVVDRKWIEDGRRGARLDAPKGLAIAGALIYVADVNIVRTFDLKTGAPRGEIVVPGATFLSGVVTDRNGEVYISDAGVPDGSFEARGTDSVYAIEHGVPRVLVAGSELRRPQAIAWTPSGLVACSFESNEIYRVDSGGAKRDVTHTPSGGLTGIVSLGDFLFVTSWQTSAVLAGKLGGSFTVALTGQPSTGDLGFDSKRERLLIPLLADGVVEAYQIR